MKKSQFELLEKCLFDIQFRDEKINVRDADIMKLLDAHNIRFEKLRKGYVFLGWPGNKEGEKIEMMSGEFYNKQLGSINMFYDKLTHNISSDTESGHGRELIENYISDILTITATRWNTIHMEREKLRTERSVMVEEELKLFESLQLLIKQKEQTEPSAWFNQSDSIPDQHLILTLSQEKLISEEECLLNELESILELRERIYKIEQKLRKVE